MKKGLISAVLLTLSLVSLTLIKTSYSDEGSDASVDVSVQNNEAFDLITNLPLNTLLIAPVKESYQEEIILAKKIVFLNGHDCLMVYTNMNKHLLTYGAEYVFILNVEDKILIESSVTIKELMKKDIGSKIGIVKVNNIVTNLNLDTNNNFM